MRSTPHIPHPSTTVAERIDEIVHQRIRFAIDPLGPSKFRLRPVEGRGNFIVSIGSSQTCTCRDPEVCSHILYVMIRFFSVPVDCDILWQDSLTDHEIEQVLDHRVRTRPEPRKQAIYKTKSGKPKVKRLPIGDEDVCPICYDSMTDCDRSKIAWCRSSCGGNFHRKCVKAWIESRRGCGEEPSCPMCREQLDMLGINRAKPKPVPGPAAPALSQDEMRELMNRDISPDDYHLLLRLDQTRVPQQTVRAKPQNQRVRAAKRVVEVAPLAALEVTGATVCPDRATSDVRAPKAGVRTGARRVPSQAAAFAAEITGTALIDQRPEVPQIQAPRIAKSPGRGGVWRGAGGQEFKVEKVRNGVPPRRAPHTGGRQTTEETDVDLALSSFRWR
jgi:hypothetical protein